LALSISADAAFSLRGEKEGIVHSVFDRAFNIKVGNELIGVVRSDVPQNPINLVVDVPPTERFPSLGIQNGMNVSIGRNYLLIDNGVGIRLEGARVWCPKTLIENCQTPEVIERNVRIVQEIAGDEWGGDGLGGLIPYIGEISRGATPKLKGANEVTKYVLPRLVNFVKAIKRKNINEVKLSAGRLIGLGPGLSPSSDDLISGLMVSSWWVSHSLGGGIEDVEAINETIVQQAMNTTLVSREILKHSAKGETNIPVQEFLEKILGSTWCEKITVDEVLRIGETSGFDMMAGLLLGISMWIRHWEI
jgi:hypothetical protein